MHDSHITTHNSPSAQNARDAMANEIARLKSQGYVFSKDTDPTYFNRGEICGQSLVLVERRSGSTVFTIKKFRPGDCNNWVPDHEAQS